MPRESTLLGMPRNMALASLVIVLTQTGLIVGLLVANRRRKRLAREQGERLRFEQILTEISGDLVEASVETLDNAICHALEKVRVMMEFQSCMLFEHVRDTQVVRILYHTDAAVREAIARREAEIPMPWLCAQFQYRKAIPLAHALQDLPADAREEQDYVRVKNIKSALIIPLHSTDGTTHGVSFCTGVAYREWSDTVISQLHALGDVLSSSVSRHRAEMELRLSEERFSKAFHASPSAMVIFRARDETILDVNESWERQFGYTYAEAAGHLPEELGIYRSEKERLRLGSLVDTVGSLRNHEITLRTRTEREVVAILSLETISIHDEACYIAIFHDVTDQRRVEEMRQSMVHVSRLALVGELTASIAHEINQPLGAILSNAEAAEMLMETENPPLDDIRQILADIRKDDLRASQVIRHIRTLVRRAPLRLLPVQVNEVVLDVLKLLSTDAQRRGIILHGDLAADEPEISADRVHLQQVLINLIVNAMDAMKSNGTTIPIVDVRTWREGPHGVSVSVRDHGHGIPEDRLPQIFESFFTTKVEGMGLGLAMARSIIEAHRGSIAARNLAEGGAMFTFTLPSGNGNGAGTRNATIGRSS
ncbi:sensor histidine kinase [Roseimicrobium gellanilyticum]|uniref:sensor histidine kinase n=1 Tax=Roseimicrobium gellanilyticum TaxID=748857 RepID=UPI001474FBCD|nr:sensor histidine kinase [Roseimicrobium gellanilyticum]